MSMSKHKAPATERGEPTTPALFMHAPRPANRSTGEFSDQCRFGDGHWALRKPEGVSCASVIVYRNTSHDYGKLQIDIEVRLETAASVELHLTADDMQTLACALLDAAHHLRTVPAAPFVAPVKADAEAVPA
jgi:hypothetical protein